MSNKLRKVLAAILAGTMVLGSGVVANAAGGESTGEGTLDQVKDKEVFSVVLPTTQETANIFDYILDPTGVIAQTNAEKYSKTATASFTPGKTMYFKNAPASGNTTIPYTDESDPITAYNKSNIDVEISVEASIATPSGIVLSSTSVATASVASPSMFIGVKASGSNTVNAITTQAKQVIATSSIASASEAYKIKYNEADDEYKLVLKDNVKNLKPTDAAFATTFESYSFVLTGDCSKAGNWKSVTEVPAVSLVWTIEKPAGAVEVTDGPTNYVSALEISTANKALQLTMPTGVNVSSLVLNLNNTPTTLIAGNHYTVSGSTLTIGKYSAGWVGGTITITYSDQHTDTITCR